VKKFKRWICDHSLILVVALVVIVGGYYMYLTHVSQVFHINGMYSVSDEHSVIVMDFKDGTLSTYLINPDVDVIAVRTDYRVGYRKYNKDILGNFWSDDGIEPFSLRGADIVGRFYAECIGSAVWPVDAEMKYYDKHDIQAMEETDDTSYSFSSRFSLRDGMLHVYNYAELDFQETESIPDVEAEIMRLLDSLCPPEFAESYPLYDCE